MVKNRIWRTPGIHTEAMNINALDIFFEQKDVNFAAYADDNTPYFLIKTLKYFSVSFRYVH